MTNSAYYDLIAVEVQCIVILLPCFFITAGLNARSARQVATEFARKNIPGARLFLKVGQKASAI